MSVAGFDIQRDFFNEARKANALVSIFLISGKRIVGKIKCFDKFTLMIETDKGDQMVFKHAISNISSSKNFGNYINFETLKPQKADDPVPEKPSADGEQ